ncbi:MAG TPA: LPS assembly protein LptD [Rudaea sp.]
MPLALSGILGTAVADVPTAPAQYDLTASSDVEPLCPVGVLKCPKKKDTFALCKRNQLLDFYTPGLPPGGDRTHATSDIFADHVASPDGTNYTLEGNAELQRLDALLKGDFIAFNSETTDYDARGHVRYQDHSMLMASDHAKGTTTPQASTLDNVRYQMLGERGNGVAQQFVVVDPDHSLAHAATYSTCDPEDRQWEIRGREMEMDQVAQEAYVHGATMYYHGVPFFWFPYLKVPLNNERESGFLFPDVAYTDRHGFVLGLPYYLNLAPNYDATLEPKEMTKRGAMLEGQFRYADERTKLQIDFNEVPHDQQVADAKNAAQGNPDLLGNIKADTERNYIKVQESTGLTANWGVAVGINHVSDPDYLHDYGESLLASATSLLQSSAYLNGRGTWWSASFGADKWEISDPSLSPAFEPYERLPHASFIAEHALIDRLALGINSEYSDFKKSDAVTGSRVDLYPYIAYPFETAAFFIRPELGWRYTTYDLSDLQFYTDGLGNQLLFNHSPSRSLPIFSLDTGLTFERDLHLFGASYTQTLEPRLFYLNVPYRNQSDLPILDTQLPTFDFPSLFRTNVFVGADRQINANSLTAALTTRLLDSASGDQVLSASFGKIYNFSTIHLQLPGYSEVQYTGEDYVGELNLRIDDRWSVRWDQQWNPNTHQTDLSGIGVERRFGREGLFNLEYTFRRGFLEQIDATTLVPVTENWSAVGRYYYSLMDHRLVEAFAGAEYDSCCVAARFLVRHYVNLVSYLPNQKADTGIYFEIEFHGLGGTGKRTENYLRRAMLGYP